MKSPHIHKYDRKKVRRDHLFKKKSLFLLKAQYILNNKQEPQRLWRKKNTKTNKTGEIIKFLQTDKGFLQDKELKKRDINANMQ